MAFSKKEWKCLWDSECSSLPWLSTLLWTKLVLVDLFQTKSIIFWTPAFTVFDRVGIWFPQRLFNRSTKLHAIRQLLSFCLWFLVSISIFQHETRGRKDLLRVPQKHNIFSRNHCLLATSEIKNPRNRLWQWKRKPSKSKTGPVYKVKYMHRSNANYKETHCEKSFQKGMNLED